MLTSPISQVVGECEVLPGDKITDCAAKYKRAPSLHYKTLKDANNQPSSDLFALNSECTRAGVKLGESAVLNANDESTSIQTATARIPATARKNLISDEALRDGDEIMATV